jgi:hypothetical protein
MRKRIASLLLCFVMLAGLLPARAMASGTTTALPTPANLKWGGNCSGVWSFYDADSDIYMPDIISWDCENLIEFIGDYALDAEYKIYRKADTSGDSDKLISSLSCSMWPKYRNVESVQTFANSLFYEFDDDSTSTAGHPKSGDYYFTVQYVISEANRNSTDVFDNLSDSPIAKSDVWHYTQPSKKLSAPTNLSYADGVLSWTQPDKNTNQIAAYAVTVFDAENHDVLSFYTDNACSTDISSSIEDFGIEYFTFKVAAVSRDITKIQNSDWSAASAVYNADGTQLGKNVYGLWFFDTQVTKDNMSDILGGGEASFNPKTNTLTLQTDNSYTVTGDTPMLKSILPSLTLRVEGNSTLHSQDGVAVDAKNLTITLADSSASLTVIGEKAAFSQKPLNVPDEIFAGTDEDSAVQKENWNFNLAATPYVRLGTHNWRWCWETVFNRGHWLGCSHDGCTAANSVGAHDLVWLTDTPAYGASAGRQHQECRICGYKQNQGTALPGTAPTITADSLLDGEVGMAYSGTVTAGGTEPFTWTVSGNLPAGLSLNSQTGEITGKPTKAGEFTFTVHVTNQVSGAAEAQKSYTVKIAESSNELRFVKWITKNGLKNADENTKENIQNAIYNLMFKAKYRPTGINNITKSRSLPKSAPKAKFTGTEEEIKDFHPQNCDYNSKKFPNSYVEDPYLKTGKLYFNEKGAGCMAYALFCTTYTYSFSGNSKTCSDRSADGIKKFIHNWADPGEQIRFYWWTDTKHTKYNCHSIVFLGESDDGNGIYCLSYGGGYRSTTGTTSHTLYVEYRSYKALAKNATKSFTVRDTNGGSYLEKTAKQWSAVKETRKGKDGLKNTKSKTIIRLNCPVEASVTLDGFILDSEYGPFERSFGTVERDGDGIVFTLDYSEDYVLDIRGTGEGTMDAEITYLDESGTSLGSQKFEKMPITADTSITSGALTPYSVAVLYYEDDGETVSAWGTNLGETATEPSDDFLSVNNTSDEEDEDEPVPSGSSGSSAAGNGVAVDSSINGSVTVNPKNASKGDTVTVTIHPNADYQLDTIKVLDKNGASVELTDKGNGIFTFTMPASGVTVKATFKPAAFPGFADVPSGSYYEEAVQWAAENGVTMGTDSTHFSPDGICTRAQAVTFLWRAAGSPAPKSSTMPFTDVLSGSYYYDAVLWAVENGITKGTSDTMFSPDATCSRGQIVTFLWRSQNAPTAGTVNPFTDVKSGAYYADAVLWAVKENITKGTGNTTFSPDDNCSRAQIVTFLWRTMT